MRALAFLFWITVFLGAVAWGIAWLMSPPKKEDGQDFDDADKAMVVSYLAARGPSRMQSIRLGMSDFTRGEQDWFHTKTERHVYRLLYRLKHEGAIRSVETSYGTEWSVVKPEAVIPLD